MRKLFAKLFPFSDNQPFLPPFRCTRPLPFSANAVCLLPCCLAVVSALAFWLCVCCFAVNGFMLCIFICLSFCLAFFVCLFRFSLFFACASAPCFAAFGARGRFKGFGLSYYVWLCCAFALAAVRRQHPLVLRLLYYFPFPAAGLVTNALPLWGNRLVAGGGGLKVFLSFIK